MTEIQNLHEDELFNGANEQPGSQRSYNNDREISRRQFKLAKDLSEVQTRAAEKQILAADAVIKNAKWIRRSTISVIIGTTVAILSFAAKLFLDIN